MINGKQMTIIWHVNDLKIFHCNGWKITKIMEWLGKIYVDIKVKHGKKHQYLGMDLDFKQKGVVKVLMVPYVEEIIDNFLEPVGMLIASTPAGDHLFQTRDSMKIRPSNFIIMWQSYYL